VKFEKKLIKGMATHPGLEEVIPELIDALTDVMNQKAINPMRVSGLERDTLNSL
jgi:hypothetical protein